jgi:hypothetical protein
MLEREGEQQRGGEAEEAEEVEGGGGHGGDPDCELAAV